MSPTVCTTGNRGPVASTSQRTALTCSSSGQLLARLQERHISARNTQCLPKAYLEHQKADHSLSGEDKWKTTWLQEDDKEIILADNESIEKPKRKLPAEMRYFDTASIYLKAGSGGNGCVAFRREKYVPRGGPSGGNGGRGGHIWAVAEDGANSLIGFRKQLHYRGSPGAGGGGSCKHGANGSDVEIKVPKGTIIRRKEATLDEPPLAELLQPGDRALLAIGGKGGRGNASFKTSSNNAPQLAESGEAGQEMWVDLELQLVADVGIVGVPNAGKSTLLAVLSAATPKVADYPFTTLVPNLGVCQLDFRTTVFADIPGILEGAHLGVGLGHEFLRHCHRCRALVHVIDGSSPDPIGDYNAIRTELQLFNPALLEKPQVVAYNKTDLPDSSDYWDDVREDLLRAGCSESHLLAISAATGSGIRDLVRQVHRVLDTLPGQDESSLSTNALNLTEAPRTLSQAAVDDFTITPDLAHGRFFIVEGAAIERFAQMTNWNYYEAQLRFQKVLEASGIQKALQAKGIREGDSVVVGEMELEWSDDQSEGAIYSKWLAQRKADGKPLQGSARWPHAG